MKFLLRPLAFAKHLATRHGMRSTPYALMTMLYLLAMALTTEAQETNLSVTVQQVSGVQRGRIENLSILGGRLCFHSDGFMLSSPIVHQTTRGSDVDLQLRNIDKNMDYATHNPVSGTLYFTKQTKSFRQTLSTLYSYDNERHRTTRVTWNEFDGDVVHPAFSSDGNTMVFSSKAAGGLGGYDLWYSTWNGETWDTPQPLGSNVNSEADETAPSICNEYLYFSSNRKQRDSSRFDLFACRLVSTNKVHGDTIFRYPIGKGKVQRLILPFNAAHENSELVYDASQQCGFYVARNATGHDQLLSFTGNIACVRLAGKAEGYYLWPSGDNAAAKTKHEKVTQMGTMDISVFDATKQHSAPVFTTQSNADGSFAIYLQPNGTFNVVFGCPGAFSRTLVLETPHDNLDDLIVDRHENVRLDCLRTNHEYAFPREAFFAHPVATELSKEGKIIVQQTAQFLIDNPTLRLYVTCIYTERDTAFNQLLCFAREDAIEQLLWRHGAPARVLNNAVFETVFQPNGENDQTNAVLLFFETPAEKRSPTTNGRMLRRSLNDFLDTQETANSNRQNNDADTRQTTTNNASTGTTPTSNGLNTDEEPSKPSEAFQKMMETGVFETQQ